MLHLNQSYAFLTISVLVESFIGFFFVMCVCVCSLLLPDSFLLVLLVKINKLNIHCCKSKSVIAYVCSYVLSLRSFYAFLLPQVPLPNICNHANSTLICYYHNYFWQSLWVSSFCELCNCRFCLELLFFITFVHPR